MLQNLRFCQQQQQQNQISHQQQQVEQIFRAAAFLPYASNAAAQISSFLWPSTTTIQQQNLNNNNFTSTQLSSNLENEIKIKPSLAIKASQRSPLKIHRQKIAYSVSSILGVSQAGKIFC